MFSAGGECDAISVALFLLVDLEEGQVADVLRWLILRNSIYIHVLHSLFVVLRIKYTQPRVIRPHYYHVTVLVIFALVETIQDFGLVLTHLFQCLYHFLRSVMKD